MGRTLDFVRQCDCEILLFRPRQSTTRRVPSRNLPVRSPATNRAEGDEKRPVQQLFLQKRVAEGLALLGLGLDPPGLGELDLDPQLDLGQHGIEPGIAGGGF
jgi:hypothetical protein